MAIGRREQISVYGDDYKTRDGTGDRDYVHVMDLAEGHVKVLVKLCHLVNIRTNNKEPVKVIRKDYCPLL